MARYRRVKTRRPLTQQEILTLDQKIRAGGSKVIKQFSATRALRLVSFKGVDHYVLYRNGYGIEKFVSEDKINNLKIELTPAQKHHLEHAKTRASERLRLELTEDDLRSIVSQILNRESIFLGMSKHHPHRSLHQVSWQGRIIKVVFDIRTHEIVTVLPSKK